VEFPEDVVDVWRTGLDRVPEAQAGASMSSGVDGGRVWVEVVRDL